MPIFRRRDPAAPKPPRQPMTRRRFLTIAGASGAGLLVLFAGGGYALRRFQANVGKSLPAQPSEPNGWLKLEPDGRVLLYVNKAEMGQGIGTALAQIVADELDVAFEQVELVLGDTNQVPADSFGTAGSASVATLYPALRAACATARGALAELAEARAGRGQLDSVVFRNGRVLVGKDRQPVGLYSYAELLQGQQIVRKSKAEAPAKLPSSYTVLGTDAPRRDLPPKVVGQAIYGYDARTAGMLHGRVARPPMIGATVGAVNLEPARGLPGVVALLHDGDFVGVAAETPDQASAALNALEVSWQLPAAPAQQAAIEALLAGERSPRSLSEQGDTERALAGAATRVSAQYRTSFAAHAQIEPQAGLADIRTDSATVWAPTQAPFALRRQVASITGLKEAQVTVVPTLLGGGFGRKTVGDAALEAARLSKAAGRPVRVAWSRTEEFANSFMRPPTLNDFEAALDAQGTIVAWRQHLATGFVLFTFFPTFLRALFGNDFGATRGALPPYAIANQSIGATVHELPVKTGSWRGLGLGPNCFAVEQFMDELALAAGADPLEFRLRHLPDDADGVGQRMRRVLETAARQAGWGTPLPPDTGRGIACGFDLGTCVAEVIEAQVDRSSGAVRVLRAVAAIDCGLAINPRNVAAQTEGAIMMGLSAGLREQITLQDGRWQADDFSSYPIFTIADAPAIEVTVIENRDSPPSGVGEPPLMPAAAALGNAIAAATGARVRAMPMTPERVLAALAQS